MNPFEYKREDFKELVYKEVIIEIGPKHDYSKITDKFEGILTKYALSGNGTYALEGFKIRLSTGDVKYFSITELRSIRIK